MLQVRALLDADAAQLLELRVVNGQSCNNSTPGCEARGFCFQQDSEVSEQYNTVIQHALKEIADASQGEINRNSRRDICNFFEYTFTQVLYGSHAS